MTSLAWSGDAAVLESAGCFDFWAGLRGGHNPCWALPGVATRAG